MRGLRLLRPCVFAAITDEQGHLDKLPTKSSDILVEITENRVDFSFAVDASLLEGLNHMA